MTLRVVARRERLAEKIRAFLDRGEDRDAFDLYHYVEQGLPDEHWRELPGLVATKMLEDDDIAGDTDLLALFDQRVATVGLAWGTRGGLVLMRDRPTWDSVRANVVSLRRYVPARRSIL